MEEITILASGVDLLALQNLLTTDAFGAALHPVGAKEISAAPMTRTHSLLGAHSELTVMLATAGAVASFARILIQYLKSHRTELRVRTRGVEIQLDARSHDFPSHLRELLVLLQVDPATLDRDPPDKPEDASDE
jgi:hypothetical protein